jgi:sulfur relay protein TusC/DsrF
MVFIDDGVYQIKKGQDTKGVEMKNFSPTYRALEMYDVEKLFVERESMEARGLTEDDFVVPVQVMSSKELADLPFRRRALDGRVDAILDEQQGTPVLGEPQRAIQRVFLEW